MKKKNMQNKNQKQKNRKGFKRKLFHCSAFLVAMVLASSPMARSISGSSIEITEAAVDCIIPDGSYAIVLYDDRSKGINVIYASTAEDIAEIGVDWFDNEANEVWIITNRGNGYVTISPSHAPDLCMNALLANKTPGDYLTLHRWTEGDAASLWLPIRNSDGSYTFQNKATGLVIDCENGSYEIGNKFLNWTQNGYLRAQGFYLEKLSENASSSLTHSIADGRYAMKLHDDENKVINVIYASTEEDIAKIGVDWFDNEANEVWIITNRGDGYVTISPSHAPDLCMNALLANKTPGDYLTLHKWTKEDAASLWLPIRNADGSYTFQNKATGLVIDCENGSYEIGNKFLNWTQNGYLRAQGFYLEKLSDITLNNTNNVSERLEQLMEEYVGTTWNGKYYGSQCKGFANLMFKKLFGVEFIGGYDSATKSYIPEPSGAVEVGRLSYSQMSVEDAKNLLQKGQPGDFIQVRRRNKTYGHTMILVNSDANGVTVFDCNSDNKNGVKKYYITWQKFYNQNSAMSLYHATNYK